MSNTKKKVHDVSFFPEVTKEELENLRNFLENLQIDLEKKSQKKTKSKRKRPVRKKKKSKKEDWRIQELPFHF